MRSSGGFFVAARSRRRLRERTGPPFLARAQAAIPEIDERRVARLQRVEAEAIAGVRDVAAVELLDQRFDAGARLPRRLGQPAGEEHVVLGLELLELGFEPRELAFDGSEGRHGALPRNQEPDQRQPQLARVRHRPIVDQHFGGVGAADDLKQIAQRRGVARPEARAVAQARRPRRSRGTRPTRARSRARARKSGTSSAGNTSVIENGRFCAPNSASYRSGSSAASSAAVGCSGSSAYGQKRSSGRYSGIGSSRRIVGIGHAHGRAG